LEDEPREASSLVEEFLGRHVVQPKELPPVDLVLASMPLEKLGENPLRLLSTVPLDGKPCRESVRHRADPRESLLELLVRLRGDGSRPRDGRSRPLLGLHAQFFKPRTQV